MSDLMDAVEAYVSAKLNRVISGRTLIIGFVYDDFTSNNSEPTLIVDVEGKTSEYGSLLSILEYLVMDILEQSFKSIIDDDGANDGDD